MIIVNNLSFKNRVKMDFQKMPFKLYKMELAEEWDVQLKIKLTTPVMV